MSIVANTESFLRLPQIDAVLPQQQKRSRDRVQNCVAIKYRKCSCCGDQISMHLQTQWHPNS